MKVAILGAGRLASLLGVRIPNTCRKVFINRHRAKAVTLADEVGGLATDQLSAVRGCQYVFLAVPGHAAAGLVQEIAPHLGKESVVVNMATDLDTDDLMVQFHGLTIVAAKLIGQVREIQAGSNGAVVLDHVTDDQAEALAELLGAIGPVVRDAEEKVLAANTAVAEEMVRVERALRTRLEDLGLAPELADAAVRTTAPGVLRAVAEGDAGPLLQEVIRRMRADE